MKDVESNDICWHRFQMMMGFSDTLLKELGIMPSYGMMDGDIRIDNVRRHMFDDVIYKISLGTIDISGMPAHSEDDLDSEYEKYIDEHACNDECLRFAKIVRIWAAYCGKDGLHELQWELMLDKEIVAIAQKFGVDSAVSALDLGVPFEDITA